ncbi:hypothetical protein BO71DRAFT_200584 [Aspergillus ellipticus CBS 707.79]|uniref:Uncharacterized protein n=1 Tax=Aspergillus ellipticus CBS 707.79 TaxID=1448320 RepID=A0A319DEE6_9EURO|nr:hypothetical protein BO71DRAFT_200584 [Aspergillus ellipticus CBS 707.79]
MLKFFPPPLPLHFSSIMLACLAFSSGSLPFILSRWPSGRSWDLHVVFSRQKAFIYLPTPSQEFDYYFLYIYEGDFPAMWLSHEPAGLVVV